MIKGILTLKSIWKSLFPSFPRAAWECITGALRQVDED